MPNRFKHYLPLSEDEKKSIWNNGLIVFDTNIWLSLYRMPEKQRTDAIAVIRDAAIEKRLFIPHQVAEEFFRNRLNVISDQVKLTDDTLKKLQTMLDKELNEIFKKIGQYHPMINKKEWKAAFKTAYKRLSDQADTAKKQYPFSNLKDDLLPQLLELFDSKISQPLANIDKVKEEADKRSATNTPPGFRDKKKDGPDAGYGDYYIWLQMMDYAKNSKKSVVFVTDDVKDDWWNKIKGEKVGVLPILRKEFLQVTKEDFIMCSSKRFFEWAKGHVAGVSQVDFQLLSAAFEESQLYGRDDEPFPLTNIPEDIDVDAIVEWVSENYETPDEAGVIWDSEDKCYFYMHGGPEDINDIVYENFEECASEKQMEDAIGILFCDSDDWVRKGLY
ncbi:DUF4935 domain-containing protein [Candidatus Pacearchaeota archaeon]|nr:DUF4935 domain-containing protein [Candidatus Pacearchaeota archaeon]